MKKILNSFGECTVLRAFFHKILRNRESYNSPDPVAMYISLSFHRKDVALHKRIGSCSKAGSFDTH